MTASPWILIIICLEMVTPIESGETVSIMQTSTIKHAHSLKIIFVARQQAVFALSFKLVFTANIKMIEFHP